MLTRFRLALLTCASLVAPVISFVHDIQRGDVDMAVVTGASIALFGLVVARMAGLVRQQERSLERERMLSSAGAALVGAAGREEIHRVAVDSARSLAGEDATALLCALGDGDRLELLAGARRRRAQRGAAHGSRPGRWPPSSRSPRAEARRSGSCVTAPRAARPRRRGRAAGAGHAGRARARQRRADRGGPPPAQRGAVRLAHPALQRPHHGARARPARSRTRARRSSGCSATRPTEVAGRRFEELVEAGDRERLARLVASGVPRTTRTTSRRSSASLVHQDGSTRQFEILMTNLLEDEHVGGIVLNSRDVSERKVVRGAARPSGVPRRRHRAGEPRAVRRARPPRDRPRRRERPRPRGDLPRPRRLQDDQRQPRPRRRRRGADRGRAPARREHPRRRHRRALRRRRVRGAARGRRRTARRPPTPPSGSSRRSPCRCVAAPQGARAALQPRHLGLRARVRRPTPTR